MANVPLSTLTTIANTTGIGLTGYSLTGAAANALLDMSGTWNTTGVATLLKVNVVNTASGAGSLLADFQVGGVSKFNIAATGNVTIAAPTSGNGLTVSNTALTTAAIVATSSTSPTGIGLYNTFADPANRNWAVLTSQNAYGDFVIRQSTAQNGNPIPAGTDRFSIGPLGNVTIAAPSSGIALTVGGASANSALNISGVITTTLAAAALTGSTGLLSSFTYADPGTVAAGDGSALALGMAGRARVYFTATHQSTSKDAIDLGIWTTTGAVAAQRVAVSSTGNVTINAPTSGASLTVNTAGSNVVVATIGGMSVSNGAVFAGSTTEIVSSPALNIGTNAAVAVGLWTNSAQRLSISSVGAATLSAPTAGVALTVSPLAGQNAIVTTGAIKFASFTVAGLPAAATVGAGSRAFATDALTPTFGATVAAGGAVFIPVYSDGTNWKVG